MDTKTSNTLQTNNDTIPFEDEYAVIGPDQNGMTSVFFCAFDTNITLQAYDEEELCRQAFAVARDECRRFERLFSRMLPHSDISLLNNAKARSVEVHLDTFQLLKAAKYYCEESLGVFDITVGPVVRLWDFHNGMIPDKDRLRQELAHVNWRTLELYAVDNDDEDNNGEKDTEAARGTNLRFFARLTDPFAAVDLGGIAKGYIADSLSESLEAAGLKCFLINLGGNVVVRGTKPNGALWRVGIQDPKDKNGILGAIELTDVSVVTSGIYERCFERSGTLYHHILDLATGFPVETDAAGVTVVAKKSLDAEGYSTTLLASGIEKGRAFTKKHPEIHAYFVDHDGKISSV